MEGGIPRRRRALLRAGLVAAGLVLGALLAELVARAMLPDAYYVWPPGFTAEFSPDPEIVHGITSPSKLTINAWGMRGDPLDREARYRLLAVGASTTIGAYLGDDETWPHLVQERLDAALGPGSAWVGNVARPGHMTHQHILQVEKLLAQHREVDGAVLLIGIADLLLHVALRSDVETQRALREARPDPEAALRRSFSVLPAVGPWYERTGLGRLWKTVAWRAPEWPDERPEFDRNAGHIRRWRELRGQAAEIRDEVPKLAPLLKSYASNVNRIIDVAQAAGRRVVFLTQPTLWRDDLTRAERDLLWMGGPPPDKLRPGAVYYSAAALGRAMQRYNERLLRVCRRRGAECFDLAARIPKTTEVFWDGAHFTEEGARQVAAQVAGYLLETEPLRSWPRVGG